MKKLQCAVISMNLKLSEALTWNTLWPFAIGRLGIFHWLKRISDRIRKNHCRCGIALRRLSACVFIYSEEDIQKVIMELRAGTLGGKKGGVGLSESEIQFLVDRGLLVKRYRRYITKTTFSPEVIEHNLVQWEKDFENDFDEIIGDQLFMRDAKDRIADAITHVGDIFDVDADHYETQPDAVSDDIKSFIDDYSKSFPETNPTRHRHRHRPTNCHFIIVHYVSFH